MEYADRLKQLDLEKQEKDEIYKLLFTNDMQFINNYMTSISNLLKDKYTISKRLGSVLQKIIETQNRAVKHAMLFFCLYQEESFVDHFLSLNDGSKIDVEKFSTFVNEQLPELCGNLLKGNFISLQDFIETSRHIYVGL